MKQIQSENYNALRMYNVTHLMVYFPIRHSFEIRVLKMKDFKMNSFLASNDSQTFNSI